MSRSATVSRKTGETDITVSINLDGSGVSDIQTGIGFFDHMLISFARHGLFDLQVRVDGDLDVDCHHSIEDAGIVLGTAIKEALGDKAGIRRFGDCILPMDETLVLSAVDLSGRPYLVFQADFPSERVGGMDSEVVKEFFYAITYSCGMNLNLKVIDGENTHHMIEALFKAFARSLCDAVSVNERVSGIPSTKGSL